MSGHAGDAALERRVLLAPHVQHSYAPGWRVPALPATRDYPAMPPARRADPNRCRICARPEGAPCHTEG